jgi:GAF domain-containing protein
MARRLTKGGKAGQAKARKASPTKGRKSAKAKRASAPAVRRRRRPSIADLEKQLNHRIDELAKAREQQAATAEVLQVISSSPGDLKPVFGSMLAKAMRLCEAQCGFIYQMEQGAMRAMAEIGVPPALAEYRRHHLHTGGATTPVDVMRATKRPAHVHDARDSDAYRRGNPNSVAGVELGGARTVLYVPMIRDDDIVGVINLYRQVVKPFTDEQIALIENFASQAVIAIENARLFNETKEALEQQKVSAEILNVISNSVADTAPVFEKILDSCERLFATEQLGIFLVQPDGQTHVAAWRGGALETVIGTLPRPVEQTATGLVVRDQAVLHIPSTAAAVDIPPTIQEMRDRIGDISIAWAPMLGEDGGIGSICVMRQPPNPFSEKELALLKTFADQAVIAIQNTRLFNETREALERQTATADILRVIASSPDDVQPVFQAIADRSNRLLGGLGTAVVSLVDGMFHLRSFTPINPAADARLKAGFPAPSARVVYGEAIGRGEIFRVVDVENESMPPGMREIARIRGWRSALYLPLLSDRKPIGVIGVTRVEPGSFSDHHVQLLQTFADQAVIAIQNVELFEQVQAKTRDLEESLQQQTATADVLKAISRSALDLTSVLQTLVESAARLCEADKTVITRQIGEVFFRAEAYGFSTEYINHVRNIPVVPERGSASGRVLLEGRAIHILDVKADAEFTYSEAQKLGDFRTVLAVPILRGGAPIGVLSLTRSEVRAFTDKQIELVSTFADQAAIAIENTRLFNETREALERQTATADILRVIASSPDNVQPVFQAIADQSNRLLNGRATAVYSLVDDTLHLASFTPVSPAADAFLKAGFPIPAARVLWGEPIRRGEVFRVGDIEDEATPPRMREMGRIRGWRSVVYVPLLSDGKPIGAISVTRAEPGSFAEHHVQLLQTFADQAVIAIQNVELFEQVQAKTRDLEASLQQQIATADVLKVISRSAFDLKTVLNTLVESAAQLCEAERALIVQPRGDGFALVASWGVSASRTEFLQRMRLQPGQGLMERVFAECKIVHIEDVLEVPGFDLHGDADLPRTRLGVPLMRDGTLIGAFALARKQMRPFTARQIELVQTFADQAVIAIENARLINETREALEQQTATADILKVIASSPDDVQPVFQAIAERSNQLVGGLSTAVQRISDDALHLMAFTSVSPEADAALKAIFPAAFSTFPWIDVILRGETFQMVDIEADDPPAPPAIRQMARLRGYRSALFVPLMRDRKTIGMIGVSRVQPGAFLDHHVQLLKTFADQAVIAISNVELFQAVQQRTRELSKSLDDLRTAQDRLVQTEKLASLGQLTAGIAHEIKNPLNFINNFSALSAELIEELNESLAAAALDAKTRGDVSELTATLKGNLEKVVQHGKRADSIVKNMLLHSRQGSGERRSADVNALVEESLNLAYHGARAERPGFQVTLKRDLDPGAGTIELYPQEITRVLLNMIANGFYAVTRRAREAEGGFEPTLQAATRGHSDRVEIRIRDNGTGIPPDVKDKMFNPFFTTKPAGEGTGLGLSMSHDIVVKQHGGTIDVETEPGHFTEFIIVLPRSSDFQGKSGGRA